jgi:hypothetical protein
VILGLGKVRDSMFGAAGATGVWHLSKELRDAEEGSSQWLMSYLSRFGRKY